MSVLKETVPVATAYVPSIIKKCRRTTSFDMPYTFIARKILCTLQGLLQLWRIGIYALKNNTALIVTQIYEYIISMIYLVVSKLFPSLMNH